MIYILLTVIFAQIIMILLLLFKTPLRKPLVVRLDELKRGRAQLVVKAIGATVFLVMMYNIYTVVEIRTRSIDVFNSPNHVIVAYRLLQALLIGFSLFLLFMIDHLHEYIRELIILTDNIMATRTLNQYFEIAKVNNEEWARSIPEQLSCLRIKIKNLESECGRKEKEVESKNADSVALKNRIEGCFVKYEHLLEDNKDLKDQLREVNEKLLHSGGKKVGFFSWDQWGL